MFVEQCVCVCVCVLGCCGVVVGFCAGGVFVSVAVSAILFDEIYVYLSLLCVLLLVGGACFLLYCCVVS